VAGMAALNCATKFLYSTLFKSRDAAHFSLCSLFDMLHDLSNSDPKKSKNKNKNKKKLPT
jgi:hypothetical protein